MILLAAALLVAAAHPADGPAASSSRRDLTILYLADLGATLEPCGCSQNQRGGLPRLASAVERVRRERPGALLLAGGDLLFEAPPTPERRGADLARARAVADALRAMGLDAAVAGERDRLGGPSFLRAARLPFTESRRLGLLGFGLPGKVPDAPLRVEVVHRDGTRGALAAVEEARRRGIQLILAAHRESLNEDDVNRAVLDGPVPVVQVQGRGQSLARIDVRLVGDLSLPLQVLEGPAQRAEEIDLAEARALEYRRRREAALAGGGEELAQVLSVKIAELEERSRRLRAEPLPEPPADRPSLTVSFIPITEDLPEDPAVRRILARAHAEAARANLAEARAHPRPCAQAAGGEAAFIGLDGAPPGGSRSCRDCHPAAAAQWSATGHARAYGTLERGSRQHDLDCVFCHVTGWKAPGGACDVARVAGRMNVQCESCHGPASLHAADPPGHIVRAPPAETCLACHTAEHSTGFEPSSYRKRILGPGHGAP